MKKPRNLTLSEVILASCVESFTPIRRRRVVITNFNTSKEGKS